MGKGFKHLPPNLRKAARASAKRNHAIESKMTPQDIPSGTFSTGKMKMESEEASFVVCWCCGSGGGRHMLGCQVKG